MAVLITPAGLGAVQEKRFDPDGTFWIQGKPAEAFADIGGINLNSRRSKRFPIAGVENLYRGDG